VSHAIAVVGLLASGVALLLLVLLVLFFVAPVCGDDDSLEDE
jgi:hypothetical protein